MVPQFNQDMLNLLRRVHVNMPWRVLPQYLGMVLEQRMNVELGFEAQELDQLSRAEIRSMADQLHQAGCRITLHGPFWDLAPGSVDPLIRQISRLRLQQVFDILDLLHPIQVVCHTGYDPRHHRGERRLWVERSLGVWEPLAGRAERMGIPLLLENVWEDGPSFHGELLERLNSSCVGFCLDVGHQHSFSSAPLLEWLQSLGGHLKEIHLHDNDGTGDLHLPIGQGTIDFGLLFDFLKIRGLAPILTLEPHREEHLAATLAGLLGYMSVPEA